MVILTFNQINRHFRLWALMTQLEKRRRRARGHGATKKIERKKMLAPLARLRETDTVATHAQAKRDKRLLQA